MSAKETAKQGKRFGDCRKCLVCGGKTISAHLGMDLCRACAVFYRRSAGKNELFDCRTGLGNCAVNKGSSCRKCRLERIVKLLNGDMEQLSLLSDESPSEGSQTLPEDPEQPQTCQPSASTDSSCGKKSAPILNRIRHAYKTACHIRLISELLARPNPPHPMHMTEEDFPLERATLGTMNTAFRICISCGVGFGRSSFPEFGNLSKEHQWAILRNYAYRFGVFESAYRANKAFPDDPDRLFSGYTYWFSHNYDDFLFTDCPQDIDVDLIKKSLTKHCKDHHVSFRSFMKRLNLSEAEFLYIAAILFWKIDDLDLPESVVDVAAKCSAEIMEEVGEYFSDESGLDNYAARLGELLTAFQMFDKSDWIKENFEFLRLMNVFNDDTFAYRLQKECE